MNNAKIENEQPPVVWKKTVRNTQLEKFKTHIENKYKLTFDSYWNLHEWTVKNFGAYWGEVWQWFGIISSKTYEQVHVKTGPGFLDNKWFPGARFNIAENILRCRDDSEAILYMDEEGNEEHMTFAQLYEEVQLYAAAMRKFGLGIGDVVCAQMSNRKEAIIALLAAASIGAIWSGAQSYLGAKASAKIISRVEPKILFIVDRHVDDGIEYNMLANVPQIIASTPSLERIVIVPTRKQNTYADSLNIPQCCFLWDFLAEGRMSNGEVPDLIFEQLPFDQPAFVPFTSGSTSIPKAPVHFAGAYISLLADYAFNWNLKKDDTVFNIAAPGWIVWLYDVFCLQLGIRIFLYSGAPMCPERNFWDIMDANNVTTTYQVPATIDHFMETNLLPSSKRSCKSLRSLYLAGCPVKLSQVMFIREHVNENIMVGNLYGATEMFSILSGFDPTLPVHGVEIQVPKLGLDIRVVNDKGESVVGQKGDVIIATPAPFIAHQLFKDTDGSIMRTTYLEAHPGVWYQNDAGKINPITKGLYVLGRNDNVHLSGGERFYPDDIYDALRDVEEVRDAICVSQSREDGRGRTVLFVKLRSGITLDQKLQHKIKSIIDTEFYWQLVPELILQIPDIPYSLNKKKLETVVRKIVNTNRKEECSNAKNPECLEHFYNIPEILDFLK